ncbi:MAG: TdeIII family type II restriction endonuclease [Chitinophagales bacterium]
MKGYIEDAFPKTQWKAQYEAAGQKNYDRATRENWEFTNGLNSDMNAFIAANNALARWTMKGMLDLKKEVMIAEEFWDFLSGAGTYNDLLDCFETAGIELRPEIDAYFGRFNRT